MSYRVAPRKAGLYCDRCCKWLVRDDELLRYTRLRYHCALYATLLCPVSIRAIVIDLWRFTLKPIILISYLLFCLAATADEAAVELGASSTPGMVDNSSQAEPAAKLDRLAPSLSKQRDEIKLITIQLSNTEDEAERKSLQKNLASCMIARHGIKHHSSSWSSAGSTHLSCTTMHPSRSRGRRRYKIFCCRYWQA